MASTKTITARAVRTPLSATRISAMTKSISESLEADSSKPHQILASNGMVLQEVALNQLQAVEEAAIITAVLESMGIELPRYDASVNSLTKALCFDALKPILNAHWYAVADIMCGHFERDIKSAIKKYQKQMEANTR